MILGTLKYDDKYPRFVLTVPTYKENPYLHTTLIAVSVTATVGIVKCALGGRFDLSETLLFGASFWLTYFVFSRWLGKRIEKRKRA